MRVLLSSVGSRGDVQPLLALALELRARGHEVLFGAPRGFGDWVGRFGVPYVAVGADIMAAVQDVYRDAHRLRVVVDFCSSMVAEQFSDLAQIDDRFDLYVGAGLQCAAQALAEKVGAPYVYVAYSPNMLRSRFHAPVFFAPQRLPQPLNQILWAIYTRMGNAAMRGPVNAGRQSLGQAPLRDVYRYVFEPGPVLLAADAALAPLPTDIGDHVEQTGFFFLEQAEPVPDAVAAFVDAGSRPVYLGFGSVPIDDEDALVRLIGQVAETTGHRLIVGAGQSGLVGAALPPSCLVAGAVDHARLFPRLAAVVHHGSAGTAATAARAGVPQVVVPHAADQFYWGHRVAEAGIGPPSLPFRKLTAERLIERIAEATASDKILERARVVGVQIAAHDGVAQAAGRLEALIGRGSRRAGAGGR